MSEVIDLKAEMLEEEQEKKLQQQSNAKLKVSVLGDNSLAVGIKTLFSGNKTEVVLFDDIDASVSWGPNLTFVCYSTELLSNDTIDDSEIITAIQKTIKQTGGGICLKTAVSPETIGRIQSSIDTESFEKRFAYNPEIYDAEDIESIINPSLIIVGGYPPSASALIDVYRNYSNLIIDSSSIEMCNPYEAAFAKLAISGFLAVKQTFFNQLYEAAIEIDNLNFNAVRRIFSARDLVKEKTTTIPTFIRVKDQNNLNIKMAKSHKGEYLNRDVKIFSAMSDKIPLIDECVNYKNLKED